MTAIKIPERFNQSLFGIFLIYNIKTLATFSVDSNEEAGELKCRRHFVHNRCNTVSAYLDKLLRSIPETSEYGIW